MVLLLARSSGFLISPWRWGGTAKWELTECLKKATNVGESSALANLVEIFIYEVLNLKHSYLFS